MKKILSLLSLSYFFLFFFALPIHAVEDPLAVPNNKVGVHILFPSELDKAVKLINTNGDWGYVTIPIQTGDKDIEKWQKFMDDCRRLHVIPLIRLATEGDYFNTQVWRQANYNDIIDFANFLNSLSWPTKNKYVIVYNEVNRSDEWGGTVDPVQYAKILDYAVSEFKFVSPDFFIIAAGMDNAAPNQGTTYMNEYNYFQQMHVAVPGVFSRIDGFASHAYPNPGFLGSPTVRTTESVYSFYYEQQLLQNLDGKKLPVFITETGWKSDQLGSATVAQYFQQAFSTVWNDPTIVAVTPFLLSANQGGFVPFSLLKLDGSESLQYTAIKNMAKVKGQPILNSHQVLSAATSVNNTLLPMLQYSPNQPVLPSQKFPTLGASARSAFKWLFRL